MKEGWKEVRLGDICTCLDNRRKYLKGSDRVKGDYPLYGGGGIADYVDSYIFDEELVLLSEDGGPFFDKSRHVAFHVTEKVYVSGHIHVLKIHDGYDPYLITTLLNNVNYKDYITGAVIPKLNKSNMLSIKLVLPENIEEQRRIANILKDIDTLSNIHSDKADVLSRMKEHLMDNKSGIIEKERNRSNINLRIIELSNKLGISFNDTNSSDISTKIKIHKESLDKINYKIEVITYLGENEHYERERD